ncbi:MAG: triose-phosphate isomerase [Alphaproteobacteria bacterium]|nr:MAG: triose-phosphate isomerase [Alphaproteobacteria bacterium]
MVKQAPKGPVRRAPKPIIIGNWKMNGLTAATKEVKALNALLKKAGRIGCDVMICPPATLISTLVEAAKRTRIAIGGQDCHAQVSGAHTGDISAEMIKDLKGKAVIVGHSERRADHGESDAIVKAKAEAALRAELTAIVCIGETEAERDEGKTLRVIGRQLKGSLPDTATPETVIVAYEPVWAIGTGRTPTSAEILTVHAFIRKKLMDRFGDQGSSFRILYGGSMKPSNAEEILALANVNGGLVGGASLKAADFFGIIEAA